MNVDGLSGLVDRVIAWADGLQRRHGVLGFPYAVVKYGDDAGGRQAALITYYGFLSIFPLLLLGVAVLSRVLADHPDLRRRLITAIVPQALRPTVEQSLASLPTSTLPFVAGLIGLLLSGTGVVFSAYQTLNHVAAVRHRFRAGFLSRYVRVFVVLATLMAGALVTGALTVVATAVPGQPAVQRAAAVLGSALVAPRSRLLIPSATAMIALYSGPTTIAATIRTCEFVKVPPRRSAQRRPAGRKAWSMCLPAADDGLRHLPNWRGLAPSATRSAATGGWLVSAASTRSTQITPERSRPRSRSAPSTGLAASSRTSNWTASPSGRRGTRLHHHVLNSSSGGQRAGELPGDSRRAHHTDMEHDAPPIWPGRTMCPTHIIHAACLPACEPGQSPSSARTKEQVAIGQAAKQVGTHWPLAGHLN